MDDQTSLPLARAAHSPHEVIEFLGQEFVCPKLLTAGVSFHDRTNEAPRQIRVGRAKAGQSTVSTMKDLTAVGLQPVPQPGGPVVRG